MTNLQWSSLAALGSQNGYQGENFVKNARPRNRDRIASGRDDSFILPLMRGAVLIGALSICHGAFSATNAVADDACGRRPVQIVLLEERGMPKRGLDLDLKKILAARTDVQLSVVDSGEIVRNGVRGDIFCNAHGEVYPVEIEDRLFEFLEQGGGLLHVGGAPFQTAMKRRERKVDRGCATFKERMLRRWARERAFRPVSCPHRNDDLCSAVSAGRDEAGCFSDSTRAGRRRPKRAWRFPASDHCLLHHPDARRRCQVRWAVLDGLSGQARLPGNARCGLGRRVGRQADHDFPGPGEELGKPLRAKADRPMRPWAIFTGVVKDELPAGLLDAMIDWLACPGVPAARSTCRLATTRRGETVEAASEVCGTAAERAGACAAAAPEVSLDDFKAGEPIRWTDAGVRDSRQHGHHERLRRCRRFPHADTTSRSSMTREACAITPNRRWFPGGRRSCRPARS